MIEYSIRPAVLEDAPALAALMRDLGYFHRLEGESAQQTTENVTAELALSLAGEAHTVLVAARSGDGGLLGYASVHWLPCLFLPSPEGYLAELFVSQETRGQGIGRALLDAVVKEARRRGCSRLQLINFRQRES